MKLAKNLKRLLSERDMTVSQLSRHTQVPTQTIHNWMTGMEPRSLKQVKKVSQFFAVSIDGICFGDYPRSEESIFNDNLQNEINAGVFEVVLRRIKNKP